MASSRPASSLRPSGEPIVEISQAHKNGRRIAIFQLLGRSAHFRRALSKVVCFDGIGRTHYPLPFAINAMRQDKLVPVKAGLAGAGIEEQLSGLRARRPIWRAGTLPFVTSKGGGHRYAVKPGVAPSASFRRLFEGQKPSTKENEPRRGGGGAHSLHIVPRRTQVPLAWLRDR
jgi:hypothetical protein